MSEEKEVIIYKACGLFACYYGLAMVPLDVRPFVEEFLRRHGGYWESAEKHSDRGITVYRCIAIPPRFFLPWRELELFLDVKIVIVQGTRENFANGCDSVTIEDGL